MTTHYVPDLRSLIDMERGWKVNCNVSSNVTPTTSKHTLHHTLRCKHRIGQRLVLRLAQHCLIPAFPRLVETDTRNTSSGLLHLFLLIHTHIHILHTHSL